MGWDKEAYSAKLRFFLNKYAICGANSQIWAQIHSSLNHRTKMRMMKVQEVQKVQDNPVACLDLECYVRWIL